MQSHDEEDLRKRRLSKPISAIASQRGPGSPVNTTVSRDDRQSEGNLYIRQ